MIRLDWKQAAPALILGCLIGAAAGVLGQRAAFHRRMREGPNGRRALERLSRKLGLDLAQKDAVKRIMDARSEPITRLHRDTQAKLLDILRPMQEEIATQLNPDQKKRFAEMTRRWNEKLAGRGADKLLGSQPSK